MNNFYDQFAATASRFSERSAVEVQRRERVEVVRYEDLARMVDQAAEWLAARECGPGDCCAILADNDARWCAAYLGILRLGAIVVPLDTAYKAAQVETLIGDCRARFVFTSPHYLALASEAADRASRAGVPCEVILLYGQAPGRVSFGDVWRSGAQPAGLPACPAHREDPAVILYTSGTTSDPKGVVLTHGNLLAEREAAFQVVHVDERDVVLGVLPLFHALAQVAHLLLPFAAGARVVFLETVNTTELMRALAERDISAFVCVPQFFYLIHQRVTREVAAAGRLGRAGFRLLLALNGWSRAVARVNLGRLFFERVHRVLGPRMRILVTGGSRFDPAIARDLHRLGFDILQAYGLTESSGAATLSRAGDRHFDSVGPPLPGVAVRILPKAAAGEDRESGDGEVAIKGPIVMAGYYGRPDATAEALRDGWLLTGDLGRLDSAGRLRITGRSKEIIVLASGKNIYPEEIEAHYAKSSFIKELCVLGLAREDEPAAERLHAVVVPDLDVMRDRHIVNTREILRFELEGLSASLPSHKRIQGYDIWLEALPRTTTAKLKRFEIERIRRARGDDGRASPERPWTAGDLVWAADPHVAYALAAIAASTSGGAAVRPESNLELDLGLDSMERVELLARLEGVFQVRVPSEVAQSLYTVRELVEALRPSGRTLDSTRPNHSDVWSALLVSPSQSDAALSALLAPKRALLTALFVAAKVGLALARIVWRFEVLGREHVPAEGPFILCANHQSYLDVFLLVSTLEYRTWLELFFVGASEYFETPLRRWLAGSINVVPVDPDSNLLRAMQAGAFGLRHEKVLVLFPEGERSIDGEPKTFKRGAAILSAQIDAPIVPVAINGLHDVWPRGQAFRWRSLLPWWGPRVRYHFGTPIPPPSVPAPGATPATFERVYEETTVKVRRSVVEMWERMRG